MNMRLLTLLSALKTKLKDFSYVRRLHQAFRAKQLEGSVQDLHQGKLFSGETGKFFGLSLQDTILEVYKLKPLQRNKGLCLFAHFDAACIVDPWLSAYFKSISEQGFDIILISTSPKMPKLVDAHVQEYLNWLILRENIGLDFGSWSAAVNFLGDELGKYSELLLCNDSILGPFATLDKIFEAAREQRSDVFGLTDSWEVEHHLQSYFLFFKRHVFRSRAFRDFWKQHKIYENKLNIISRYEVGLSTYLTRYGYRLDSYAPYEKVKEVAFRENALQPELLAALHNDPQNPTLVLWDILVQTFQVPFLKAELLKRNPHNHLRVSEWKSIVSENPSLIKLVDDYLSRQKGGKA